MKKLLVVSLIAGSLVIAPNASQAATKSPKPKITGAPASEEGTAAHEAGEGKSVEKKETGKKKKVIKKKKM